MIIVAELWYWWRQNEQDSFIICAIADIWRISDGMLLLQETIYICFQKKNYCLEGGGGRGDKIDFFVIYFA